MAANVAAAVAQPDGAGANPPPGDGEEHEDEEDVNVVPIELLKVQLVMTGLGLSKEAVEYLTDTQAINSLETLGSLDEEEITQLCKVCRKPGGTKSGTKRTRNGTNDADPGIPVAIVHETNLKLANFYIKLLNMTSRKIVSDDITVSNVRLLKDFKTELMTREDPDISKAPQLTSKKMFEFFESLREYLTECTGTVSKRPLAYVIRPNKLVKDSDGDVPYGQPGTKYRNRYHEIEERAPISIKATHESILYVPDVHFVQDNVKVWKILYAIVKDTHYLPYIKKYNRSQDGRAAFLALYDQLLGKQAIDNYATQAETKLQSLTLDGQKRKNWDFETYVTAHMEQHAIIDRLMEHGHNGLAEATKIRLFIQGITDPNLAVCRLAVSSIQHEGFDSVVTTYRTHIQTNKSLRNNRQGTLNISQMSSSTGNRTRDKTSWPTVKTDGYDFNKDYSKFHIKDVYYKRDAWSKLSKGQRNYLRQKRKQKKRDGDKTGETSAAKYKAKISALKAKVASLKSQQEEDDTSSNDSDSDTENEPPPKKKSRKDDGSDSKSKTKIIRKRS